MHFTGIIRGEKHNVERIFERLNSVKFVLPVTLKSGKKIYQPCFGRLEEIKLFSFVFPEEYRDNVLSSLGADKENMARWYGTGLKNQTALAILRKALHHEKIPEFTKIEDQTKLLALPVEDMEHIAITPIGIKKDIKEWIDQKSYFNPETKEWEDTTHEAL